MFHGEIAESWAEAGNVQAEPRASYHKIESIQQSPQLHNMAHIDGAVLMGHRI